MKALHTLFIGVLCGMALPAVGQTTYLQGVSVQNQKAVRQGDRVLVTMDIVADGIDVKSNDMVVITPVIQSNSDNTAVELAPVVLAGRKRATILRRNQSFGHPLGLDTETTPYAVVKRSNNKVQTVAYTAEVANAGWMKDASLKLKENVKGCANCNRGDGLDYPVTARFLPGDYKPAYQLTYLMPQAEVKTRSDRHSATFNYVVDRYELRRDYKGNEAKFNEVDNIIKAIKGNKDVQITKLDIEGYASPEGTVAHNQTLAKNRATSFANYLVSNFGIKRNQITVKSYGEDWDGLRAAVAASDMKDRQAVLDIIDNVANPDARDARLQKLSGGTTWRDLLDNYYPALRRTEYTVAYTVRPFNVEEAKEIIKTDPKLLSLNEMYMVAQSYPAGSKEFKEVFDISARVYPDNALSILNSASTDIEAGNVDGALQRMGKISADERTWNDIGVANALKGNYTAAREYLNKAAAKGDANAKHNLAELEKLISQQ